MWKALKWFFIGWALLLILSDIQINTSLYKTWLRPWLRALVTKCCLEASTCCAALNIAARTSAQNKTPDASIGRCRLTGASEVCQVKDLTSG